MQIRIFILLSLIIIALSSCDLNSETNYKPVISLLKNPIITGKDTLNVYYTGEADVYKLDTIHVGDTVNIYMYIDGFSNNLSNYYMTQSADTVSKIILPNLSSMDSVFLSTSDYSKGLFNLKGGSTTLFFPFKYVARKASLEARITFSVVSDAKFEYNQSTFVLKTPIIQLKTKN
jgi:hypothetical protein